MCLYGKSRSRFASVLRVAFEDTMLTQCDFYRVLKCNTICVRPLLVHTCTYALIVVFKSAAQLFTQYKILCNSRYNLDLASPLRISTDMDPCSCVARPTMYMIIQRVERLRNACASKNDTPEMPVRM